jgi:hypothetical protein
VTPSSEEVQYFLEAGPIGPADVSPARMAMPNHRAVGVAMVVPKLVAYQMLEPALQPRADRGRTLVSPVSGNVPERNTETKHRRFPMDEAAKTYW